MAQKKKPITVEPVDITPADSVVPVYLIALSEAELAERDQWEAETVAREQAEIQRASARESALAKLAALGLSDPEIEAITNQPSSARL